MNIEVRHSHGIPALGLVEQVRRRLGAALERFSDRVFSVHLFLSDANGPRGGRDMQCRAVARVRGVPDVVIEDLDQELDPLLNRVADRLSHTVARRLKRRRFGHDRVAFGGI